MLSFLGVIKFVDIKAGKNIKVQKGGNSVEICTFEPFE